MAQKVMTWLVNVYLGTTLTLVVTRRNGEVLQVPVTCRLDTAEEVSIYEAGGVLQRFAKDFLEAKV